jgi:hypothetical protein
MPPSRISPSLHNGAFASGACVVRLTPSVRSRSERRSYAMAKDRTQCGAEQR